jgi:hypothetical protein
MEMFTLSAGRRAWLRAGVAGVAVAVGGPVFGQPAPMLIDQPAGGLRFAPGGQVFASGAVAAEGHGLVHAILDPWLPLDKAYAFIEAHLRSLGRPMQALCGVELRLPRQLSREEFDAFNQPYVQRLIEWGLLVEGRNPVSRTNVAPAMDPPEQPMLHGFTFSMPGLDGRRDFVMAGMTETGPGGRIVAAGDTSPAGLREKVRYVVEAVSRRLDGLGRRFDDASHVEFYAALPAEGLVTDLLIPAIDAAGRRGLRWHFGRPPVTGLEVELEARRASRETVLPTR